MVVPINSADPATTFSQRSVRSWCRWGSCLVIALCAVVAAVQACTSSREGEWLAGQWQHHQAYEDGAVVRIWTFQTNGRIKIVNDEYDHLSRRIRREDAGRWYIRNGKLTIKCDRPIHKDLILSAARMRESVRHVLTGQSQQLLDAETSEGQMTHENSDQFTVRWYDPSAKKLSESQEWTRVR